MVGEGVRMATTAKQCACGEPLHYHDPEKQAMVEELVADLGEYVTVKVLGASGKAYAVPRHFIALHGVKADQLPALAAAYGFKEVAATGNSVPKRKRTRKLTKNGHIDEDS